MEESIKKAAVLIEALPYIQRFRGTVIVVKFGGSAMEDKAHHDSILADIAFMECVDMLPIIVHGGGKAISRGMKEEGLDAVFINGLRVTDERAIKVVEKVLSEEVSPGIVAVLEQNGGRAKMVSGKDIFTVSRKAGVDNETGAPADWGYVGELEAVDIDPIQACLEADIIPVITPMGKGPDGKTYNINADIAATAMAKAVKARKLAFLSDVPGLLQDPGDEDSILTTLAVAEVEGLIEKKVIAGGMLPKVAAAVDALHSGVTKVHIVDGRLSHSLLLEIFTDKGVGTEIIHDDL